MILLDQFCICVFSLRSNSRGYSHEPPFKTQTIGSP